MTRMCDHITAYFNTFRSLCVAENLLREIKKVLKPYLRIDPGPLYGVSDLITGHEMTDEQR